MQERLQSNTAAHTLPSWRARAICALLLCFSPSLLPCLTLQRINRATTVVACLPDFASYINYDGQGGSAAFVSIDIILTGGALKGKFERLASDSHFRSVQNCSGQTAKFWRLNVRLHHRHPPPAIQLTRWGSLGSPQQYKPSVKSLVYRTKVRELCRVIYLQWFRGYLSRLRFAVCTRSRGTW